MLHEEVLRGVHMLSVGPLAPGAEVEVRFCWAMTLTFVGGTGRIRIPLTVGDIYGRSPLADGDDLLTGGETGFADLRVRSADGSVTLLGGALDADGRRARAAGRADRPRAGDAERRGRDRALRGRTVGDAARDAPPGERRSARRRDADRPLGLDGRRGLRSARPESKHARVLAALIGLAPALRDGDALDLWQFDDSVGRVGVLAPLPAAPGSHRPGARFRSLVAALDGPSAAPRSAARSTRRSARPWASTS